MGTAAFDKIYDMSRPHFVNGTWHRPKLSRRRLADLRKEFILKGIGWDPKLEKTKSEPKKEKKPKGVHHKRKAARLVRIQKIIENVPKEPKILEDMRVAYRAEKKKTKKAADFLKDMEKKPRVLTAKEKEDIAVREERRKQRKKKFSKENYSKLVKQRVERSVREGRI